MAQTEMSTQLPYRQSYQYDAFSNMTQRNNLHWGIDNWYGQTNNLNYNYSPSNNRIAGWNYDADGRVTTTAYPDDYNVSTYDASGMLSHLNTNGYTDIYRYYDGNGRESKRRKQSWIDDPISVTVSPYGYWADEGNTYYIRSSILGNEVISEVNRYGDKIKTNVLAAGNKIATQENHLSYQQVIYEQWDASGQSYRASDKLGISYAASDTTASPGELDPMGGNVGLETPYIEQPIEPPPPSDIYNEPFLLDSEQPMYVNGQKVSCSMDGMTVSCGMAMRALENGSAIPSSIAWAQRLPGFRFEHRGLGIFDVNVPEKVGEWWRNVTYTPTKPDTNETIQVGSSTGWFKVADIFKNRSWSVDYSMISVEYKVIQQQQGQQDISTKPLKGNKLSTYTRAREIADKALQDKDCIAAINKIFGGAIPFLNANEIYQSWINLGYVDGGKSNNTDSYNPGRWLGGNKIALFDDFFANSSNSAGRSAMFMIANRIQKSDLLNPPIRQADDPYYKQFKDTGSYYLTDDQLRAFVVLHEAVHAILQKTHRDSELKDWDKTLWNGCFRDKIVFAHH